MLDHLCFVMRVAAMDFVRIGGNPPRMDHSNYREHKPIDIPENEIMAFVIGYDGGQKGECGGAKKGSKNCGVGHNRPWSIE